VDKFTLIPWDVGSTFWIGGGFVNIPRWTDAPRDCGKYYPVWEGNIGVISPGCDRFFRALAADLGAYRTACREFLDGPFREKAVFDLIDKYAAFIKNAVKADPLGPGIAEFENAVRTLKREIPQLRLRLESFTADKALKPVPMNKEKGLNFETYDNSNVTALMFSLQSPSYLPHLKKSQTSASACLAG
jgi:hypothetical protein